MSLKRGQENQERFALGREALAKWRWSNIGFIMRPELVKKRETFLPLSAMREMDSADTGFFLGDMLSLG